MMLSGMSRSLVRACMVIFAVLSVFTGVALHGVTDVVIGRAAPPFRVLNPHAADSVAVSVPGCVARHLAQPHAAGSVAEYELCTLLFIIFVLIAQHASRGDSGGIRATGATAFSSIHSPPAATLLKSQLDMLLYDVVDAIKLRHLRRRGRFEPPCYIRVHYGYIIAAIDNKDIIVRYRSTTNPH
ncbi:hypothetical protein M885DRAFT_581008 [Pelagophyceae sp. CCMP2097]|nr:hypothetical protein M885DRAFT_581008 [Pelagophyceae sp. CCMP2097]